MHAPHDAHWRFLTGRMQATPFDVRALLAAAGLSCDVVRVARGAIVFAQGAEATSLFYVQEGFVKLSVVSAAGLETIVATVGSGEFFGEGCLGESGRRAETATAMTPTTALRIPRRDVIRLLHEQPAFGDRLVDRLVARSLRLEDDLVDQRFNRSEKRLARILLLLARAGEPDVPEAVPLTLSQETLAKMIGTTRPRVNFLLRRFRKRGLVSYKGRCLTINRSLLSKLLCSILISG